MKFVETLFYLLEFLFLLYVYGSFSYICVCAILVYLMPLWWSEEGVKSPGTLLTDGCELPCEYWEPTLDSLQDQQVLLTEHSLQPQNHYFILSQVICIFSLI